MEMGSMPCQGKSQEGRKFKSRISFWTLRPTEIGEGGYKADRKKVGNFLVPQRIRDREGDGF